MGPEKDNHSVVMVAGSTSRLAGGLFESVRGSALAVRGRGVQVKVFGLWDEYSVEDLTAWRPVVPRNYKANFPRFIGFSSELARELDQEMADLVHQQGIWQGFSYSIYRWGKKHNRPVVISPRGMLDEWALKNSYYKKVIAGLIYETRNLRGACCFQALTRSEAMSLRSLGLEQPIAVIPNGIMLPEPTETYDRPRLLPNDGKKVLLFLGRLHSKKGLVELCNAWISLIKNHSEVVNHWRLVIAGWGEDAILKQLISLNSEYVGDQILLYGPAYGNEKAALYAASDAFILPSYSEGLPMSILEAWSFSLPVLMTAACNLENSFQNYAAIEISNQPELLCHQLQHELMREDLGEFGIRGRLLAENRYSWEQVGIELESVYRWCTSGGKLPDCMMIEN